MAAVVTTFEEINLNVIEEANEIINGERREQYGDPVVCFGGIARMWSAYLGHEVTPIDVAQLMILLKVHRNREIWKRDSVVDVIGYAALAERLHNAGDETPISDGVEMKMSRTDLGKVYWKLADVPDDGTSVYDYEGYDWVHEPEDSGCNFDQHGPFYELDPTR